MTASLMHGGDYNPEQWLDDPEIMARDFAVFDATHINTVTVGVFSWTALEPRPGEYHFEWLDEVFAQMQRRGGNVILATPSGARPAWLAQQHPEVLRTNANGQRRQFGQRHNHCFTAPSYRTEVKKIDTMLAKRYGQHPALKLWHISNEFSGACYCSLCQDAFRRWLQARYHTLEQLNHAWWTSFWAHHFNSWDEIMPPSTLGDANLNGLNLDWRRFTTDQTIDFCQTEIDAIRAYSPEVPVTTNFMANSDTLAPFGGLDYEKFARTLDVISWDCYPHWDNPMMSNSTISMRLAMADNYFYQLKRKPFLLMESSPSRVNWHTVNRAKRPGVHRLSSLQIVGDGADSVLYFQLRQSRGASEQFHGAVIEHDNRQPTRAFKEVQQVGRDLEGLTVLINTSRITAKVALIYAQESDWALQDAQGYSPGAKQYWEVLQQHFAYFWQAHIPVDVITPDHDLEAYTLVIDPMHFLMTKEFAAKIAKYVDSGGSLVGGYLSGVVNESTLTYLDGLPDPLEAVFGLSVEETDIFYPQQHNAIVGGEFQAVVSDVATIVQATTAESLASYQNEFYAGEPAILKNRYATGTAYYLAAKLDDAGLAQFYAHILPALAVEPAMCADPQLGVSARVDAENIYLVLTNYGEAPLNYVAKASGTSLLTGESLNAGKHQLKAQAVEVLSAPRHVWK